MSFPTDAKTFVLIIPPDNSDTGISGIVIASPRHQTSFRIRALIENATFLQGATISLAIYGDIFKIVTLSPEEFSDLAFAAALLGTMGDHVHNYTSVVELLDSANLWIDTQIKPNVDKFAQYHLAYIQLAG